MSICVHISIVCTHARFYATELMGNGGIATSWAPLKSSLLLIIEVAIPPGGRLDKSYLPGCQSEPSLTAKSEIKKAIQRQRRLGLPGCVVDMLVEQTLLGEQILSLKSWPPWKGRQKLKVKKLFPRKKHLIQKMFADKFIIWNSNFAVFLADNKLTTT